jgi:hypothetical protein
MLVMSDKKPAKARDARDFETKFPARTIYELAGNFDLEMARLGAEKILDIEGKLKGERFLNAIIWAFLELPEAERNAIAAEYVVRFNHVMRAGEKAVIEVKEMTPPASVREGGAKGWEGVPLEGTLLPAKKGRKKSGNDEGA